MFLPARSPTGFGRRNVARRIKKAFQPGRTAFSAWIRRICARSSLLRVQACCSEPIRPSGAFRVFSHGAPTSIYAAAVRANQGKPAEGEEILDLDALADELTTDIDLECAVLVAKNGSDTWNDVNNDPSGLPLQEDDRFKLKIKSEPPSHIYVAILDAEGEVTPLFPWLMIDKSKATWGSDDPSLRSRDIARSRLSLPDDFVHLLSDEAKCFSVGGVGGAETLLILARREEGSLAAIHDALTQFWVKEDAPIQSVDARNPVRFDVWPPRRKPAFLSFRAVPAKRTKLAEVRRKLQERLNEMRPIDRAIMLSIPSRGAKEV